MSEQKPLRETIAKRLRLSRELAGLSQSQVAKMMGLQRPAISEIEAGNRKVSAEELVQFAKIYSVDMHWLAGRDPNENDEEEARIQFAAREIAKLKDDDIKSLQSLLKIIAPRKKTS